MVEPRSRSTTSAISMNGGQITISSRAWFCASGRNSRTKACACSGVLYIFQLAAMILRLVIDAEVDLSGCEFLRDSCEGVQRVPAEQHEFGEDHRAGASNRVTHCRNGNASRVLHRITLTPGRDCR